MEKAGSQWCHPSVVSSGLVGLSSWNLFLPDGCGLAPGDRVRWLLRDAVTGELLAEQEAISQVDLW